MKLLIKKLYSRLFGKADKQVAQVTMESNVVHFNSDGKKKTVSGGEPPMSTIENRVESLERNVSTLQKDVAVIASNYVTKEDLLNLKVELKADISSIKDTISSNNRWMITTMIAIAGLALAAAKLLF